MMKLRPRAFFSTMFRPKTRRYGKVMNFQSRPVSKKKCPPLGQNHICNNPRTSPFRWGSDSGPPKFLYVDSGALIWLKREISISGFSCCAQIFILKNLRSVLRPKVKSTPFGTMDFGTGSFLRVFYYITAKSGL